jgi:hypothetical protein
VAGQYRTQFGRLGGDDGVRARSVASAYRDQPDALAGDLPPDPEAGEILLQRGELTLGTGTILAVAHGRHPGAARTALAQPEGGSGGVDVAG